MSLSLHRLKSGGLAVSPSNEFFRPGNDPDLFIPLDAVAGVATNIELSAAAFSFSGLSLQPSLAAQLSAASFQFVGQAITVLASTAIMLTAAVFTFTALAIEVTGASSAVRRVRTLFRRFGALGRL